MIKQLILLFFVFFLMAGLAIAAIWTQIIPEYRAEAEIRVAPIIPYLVFQTEDNGMIPLYESFVNTQISIMKSTIVLDRVLDQPEVQETLWYKEPPVSLMQQLQGKPPVPPIERLRNLLSIQHRPKSEIIDITFTDSSSKDAKIIVNAVVDQYIQYIGETTDKTKDYLYAKLLEQSSKLSNEIAGREQIITELRKSIGTRNPQELITGMRFRLDEAQARLSDLRQTIVVLEWELKEKANLDSNAVKNDSNNAPEASVVEIEKKPKYHEDSEWRALDINVRTIQHNLTASELDPNNPEIIRATKDLDFAKELLRLRETQLDEQWNDRPKKIPEVPITITSESGPDDEEDSRTLEFQLDRAKKEAEILEAELTIQETNFNKLSDIAQSLEKENNALQHKRELFKAVQQRIDQKNMERNVPGSIAVLTRAFAPSEPHKDRRILYTAIVVILDTIGIILSACILHRHGFL